VFIPGTNKPEIVDLNLAIKALPDRVTERNCEKVMLFDFKMCEVSLIAF
jgi:hypothetical protein